MGTKISSQQDSIENPEIVLEAKHLNVYYGDFLAVRDVNMVMKRNTVTALIGPSGCGKSTYLRCLNRMNDLIVGASVKGEVLFENFNIYSDNVDATEIRSRIGMVFQKPNPFPKSIYQNVAFGLMVIQEIWMRLWRVLCIKRLCGKRLRTGYMTVRLPSLVVSNKDFV